jgi:hypothetical protein
MKMETKVKVQKNKNKKTIDAKVQRYSWIIGELLTNGEILLDDVVELYIDNDEENLNKKPKTFEMMYKRDLQNLEYMKLIVREEINIDTTANNLPSTKKTVLFKLNPKKQDEWDEIIEKSDIYLATYTIIGMSILRYEFGIPSAALRNTKIDDIPFGKTITLFSIEQIQKIHPSEKDTIGKEIENYLKAYHTMKDAGQTDNIIKKELQTMQKRIDEKLIIDKSKLANHKKRWTNEMNETLVTLLSEGNNTEEVSEIMERTVGAIKSQTKAGRVDFSKIAVICPFCKESPVTQWKTDTWMAGRKFPCCLACSIKIKF